jgi:hypothetical protein
MTKSTALTATRQHLTGLVRSVLDSQSESVRAANARTLADDAGDLRQAVALAQVVLSSGGCRALDLHAQHFGGKVAGAPLEGSAVEREQMRAQLQQMRAFATMLPGPEPVLTGDGSTGYGPAPLIRGVAMPSTEQGQRPVVPGTATGGPFAVMDPDPDQAEVAKVLSIVDVADPDGWHYAGLVFAPSRHVLDFTQAEGAQLLDRVLFDDVDTVAEGFVAAQLIAGAGGTRAVTALADDLEAAEVAAGVNGPVALMIVNPQTWPIVRRTLPAGFFDGPHPRPLLSAGQPVGTVTYVGHAAMHLFVRDYASAASMRPRSLSQESYILRPVYVTVRDAAAVQTVTGIA